MKISEKVPPAKWVSVLSMMLLLLFLTNVNQFIYSSGKDSSFISWNCEDDDSRPCLPGNPAGPDEKTPDAPVSINEEYIHHHESPVNPFWANALFEHMIHAADKLCQVHSEIHSPPPNA